MKMKTGFSNPIRVWRFNGQPTASIKSYKGNELSDQILSLNISCFCKKCHIENICIFVYLAQASFEFGNLIYRRCRENASRLTFAQKHFLKSFHLKIIFDWKVHMKTQNCTIYEHGLFWCILMIRFARLVKFYGILVAMHQQRNTQRLTGRNTQRLNWQFGKLQNLLQW